MLAELLPVMKVEKTRDRMMMSVLTELLPVTNVEKTSGKTMMRVRWLSCHLLQRWRRPVVR